ADNRSLNLALAAYPCAPHSVTQTPAAGLRPPAPPCRTATHRLIKNLSSARDERSFRGTTLIVASTIQLSRTKLIGGPEGARTPDLIHAIDALSQLRYRPMLFLGNE